MRVMWSDYLITKLMVIKENFGGRIVIPFQSVPPQCVVQSRVEVLINNTETSSLHSWKIRIDMGSGR